MTPSILISLFLLTAHYHASVTVDAFMAKSKMQTPARLIHGRSMLSYSSKVSMVSKESSTAVVDSVVESSEVPTAELSSEETKTINSNSLTSTSTATKEKDSSDESEEDNLMKQIKESGVAGVISYAAWVLAFWTVSVPVCVLGYKEVTGWVTSFCTWKWRTKIRMSFCAPKIQSTFTCFVRR